MADLIKQVPLVKIATIREKDLDQIDTCNGLRLDDDGSPYQQEAGKERRELEVMGWLRLRAYFRLLVQRDDGRLLAGYPGRSEEKVIVDRYSQLFVR